MLHLIAEAFFLCLGIIALLSFAATIRNAWPQALLVMRNKGKPPEVSFIRVSHFRVKRYSRYQPLRAPSACIAA
jgi:hypothetical protein